MRHFLHHYKQALAYVLLALAVGLVVHVEDQRTTASRTLALCHNQNIGRHFLNHHIAEDAVASHILSRFMSDAERARYAAYLHDHTKTDLKAAQEYGQLERILDSTPFTTIPYLTC